MSAQDVLLIANFRHCAMRVSQERCRQARLIFDLSNQWGKEGGNNRPLDRVVVGYVNRARNSVAPSQIVDHLNFRQPAKKYGIARRVMAVLISELGGPSCHTLRC